MWVGVVFVDFFWSMNFLAFTMNFLRSRFIFIFGEHTFEGWNCLFSKDWRFFLDLTEILRSRCTFLMIKASFLRPWQPFQRSRSKFCSSFFANSLRSRRLFWEIGSFSILDLAFNFSVKKSPHSFTKNQEKSSKSLPPPHPNPFYYSITPL